MSVLLIAGSPSEHSRCAALLEAVGQRLQFRGALVDHLQIRNLSHQALVLADFFHPTISQAIGQVAKANVVVVATPIYQIAYSGVLKIFLDLLPQTALQGKTILPLATSGSPNHMLALDYALRPVLQSLGAKQILPSIYATDAQVSVTESGASDIHADIAARLDEAVNILIRDVHRPTQIHARRFAPVHFSQVRCSV
ncbi:MAG: NADPH-dependent FMN reductase [Rhodoferax sp.]